MNLDEFKHLWESGKDDWVLINTEDGYGIVNKRTHMAMLIGDDALDDAVTAKMLESGNSVYDNIDDAFNDI